MKTAIILVLVCVAVFCLIACSVKDSPEHTGMPDPEFIRRQKTVKKASMVYGTDRIPITVTKPETAYFTALPGKAADGVDRVYLKADDGTWSAEIFSTVYSDNNDRNEDFAEYYFSGKTGEDTSYEYFCQNVTDIGATYGGKPVKRITSTYKTAGDSNTYEICFVGFEFSDTSVGKGLMGFKIYSIGREISDKFVKSLFNEMFRYER